MGRVKEWRLFVVLSEPPIEHPQAVCYKILFVGLGGSGDGQREFESRLWPPFKFSQEDIASPTALHRSGISPSTVLWFYAGPPGKPLRAKAEGNIPIPAFLLWLGVLRPSALPLLTGTLANGIQTLHGANGQRIRGEVSLLE